MKVVLGSDHHGIETRSRLAALLRQAGHDVVDVGASGGESVDYPDVAEQVARTVSSGAADRGILICGSGIGMAIAANKVQAVRAAACYDEWMATMCRQHNDANILCLSDDLVAPPRNLRLAEIFLATEFHGGRHQRRVAKIMALDGPQSPV